MIANMIKRHQSKILTLVAIAVVVYLLTTLNKTSDYSINEREYVGLGSGSAIGPSAAPVNGGMQKGTGLASSLLPREVASEEGQFAPEDILKGQNFLEPRAQVGFPETVGGALRNANQQIRADPPNAKDPFVWNNSTIVPDLMQRSLCA
jgi:hypothetical protein